MITPRQMFLAMVAATLQGALKKQYHGDQDFAIVMRDITDSGKPCGEGNLPPAETAQLLRDAADQLDKIAEAQERLRCKYH